MPNIYVFGCKLEIYAAYCVFNGKAVVNGRGLFFTIFGNIKAIKSFYFLTGLLTFYPSGKLENEGQALYNKYTKPFVSNLNKLFKGIA